MLLSQLQVLLSLWHCFFFCPSVPMLILSHALCASLTAHCSFALSHAWYLAAVCMYVCNACSLDWTASEGRLLVPGRTCHIRKHFFLIRAFTVTRMFPGFPLYLKKIPQHLSDFHVSAFFTFWGAHGVFYLLWICVWVFDWKLKSNSCRPKWKQAPLGLDFKNSGIVGSLCLDRKWLSFVIKDVTPPPPNSTLSPSTHIPTHTAAELD